MHQCTFRTTLHHNICPQASFCSLSCTARRLFQCRQLTFTVAHIWQSSKSQCLYGTVHLTSQMCSEWLCCNSGWSLTSSDGGLVDIWIALGSNWKTRYEVCHLLEDIHAAKNSSKSKNDFCEQVNSGLVLLLQHYLNLQVVELVSDACIKLECCSM